jgi:dUTP pyrophosphatase
MAKLKVKLADEAQLPQYLHPGDAGLDLYSNQNLTLPPLQRALCSTGLYLEIPPGHAGLVLPRSGQALKVGLSVLNAPGLIDSNYRGEIQIILYNSDAQKPINIAVGDRVAQLLIIQTPQVEIETVVQLNDSERGTNGFGSTD